MLYIPLRFRNPLRARFYEFFCCLLNFYALTILVISYKTEVLSLHGYCVLLTLELIVFLFDLTRRSLIPSVRGLFAMIRGRAVLGRPHAAGWWAWCVPENEAMIKEVIGIDMKLLFFALSGMLAQHLSPLPGGGGDPITAPQFDHLMCLFFIVSTRLICLSAIVIIVNLMIQLTNLLA